jgi:hypothetical protein
MSSGGEVIECHECGGFCFVNVPCNACGQINYLLVKKPTDAIARRIVGQQCGAAELAVKEGLRRGSMFTSAAEYRAFKGMARAEQTDRLRRFTLTKQATLSAEELEVLRLTILRRKLDEVWTKEAVQTTTEVLHEVARTATLSDRRLAQQAAEIIQLVEGTKRLFPHTHRKQSMVRLEALFLRSTMSSLVLCARRACAHNNLPSHSVTPPPSLSRSRALFSQVSWVSEWVFGDDAADAAEAAEEAAAAEEAEEMDTAAAVAAAVAGGRVREYHAADAAALPLPPSPQGGSPSRQGLLTVGSAVL